MDETWVISGSLVKKKRETQHIIGLLTAPQTAFHLLKVRGYRLLHLLITEKIKGIRTKTGWQGCYQRLHTHHCFSACFSFLCIQTLPSKIWKFQDSSRTKAEKSIFGAFQHQMRVGYRRDCPLAFRSYFTFLFPHL